MNRIYFLKLTHKCGRSEITGCSSSLAALSYSRHWYTTKFETELLATTGIVHFDNGAVLEFWDEYFVNDHFLDYYEIKKEAV